MTLPRAVLVLFAVAFLAFGVAYILWPLPMAQLTGIPLPSPDARIDFAATYGGIQLAIGVFLIRSTRREAWIEPALWIASAICLGMALVRLQSMLVIGGRPTRVIYFALAIELAGFLLSAAALRSFRQSGVTA